MCLCHAPPLRIHGRRQMLCGAATVVIAAPLLTGCDSDDWTFNLVPESQVQAMAARSWAQLRQSVPPSQDEKRQDIIRRIADRLLSGNGQNPAAWQVELFASQQVNAFALPGGRIGVFEGMFRVAANSAQMAAVIGHEIGHVLARHSEARMNAQAWQHFGLWVVRIALGLGDVPYSDQIAAVLGLGAEYGLLLPYSRHPGDPGRPSRPAGDGHGRLRSVAGAATVAADGPDAAAARPDLPGDAPRASDADRGTGGAGAGGAQADAEGGRIEPVRELYQTPHAPTLSLAQC
jgi:Peptidase family M48